MLLSVHFTRSLASSIRSILLNYDVVIIGFWVVLIGEGGKKLCFRGSCFGYSDRVGSE